jgi:hypothetical protein
VVEDFCTEVEVETGGGGGGVGATFVVVTEVDVLWVEEDAVCA